MIRREVEGPDTGTERSGAQVYRDIRPGSIRLGAALRSSFSGFLLFGGAGTVMFEPATLDLLLPAGMILSAYVLWSSTTLPIRLPKHSRIKDRNHPSPVDRKPRMAAGTVFIGHDYKTGQQVWIADEDERQHVVVAGTTGAGKTRALLSLMVNKLIQGSGFIFVDGKADNSLYSIVLWLARRFGREDDVLTLNFMVASGDKHTSTFNPFASCNADVLRELLTSQIEQNPTGGSGDSNGVFRAGATALLGSLAPVLVWMRDNKGVPIDIEVIRFSTELQSIATLVKTRAFRHRNVATGIITEIPVPDMPEGYIYPLKAYLGETGDFDTSLEWNKQKTNEPSRQHSFVVMHFRETFTQLSVSLGHIFKCEVGDIDMRDIVLNRRILVVNLPTLENSGETTAALGKIVVATLRNMMAQTLGADLEGDYQEIVANKASFSPAAFGVVFDEVGYYAVAGMDKMLAMGRALGFAFYLGFQETSGLLARLGETLYSLLGNANLQILMRLQEGGRTRQYVENTAGDSFVTQASSYDATGTGGYRESMQASVRQTKRINWNDLRKLIEGEAVVLFGQHRVHIKLFDVDPKPSGVMRMNRPLPLIAADRPRLRAERDHLDGIIARISSQALLKANDAPQSAGIKTILAGMTHALKEGAYGSNEMADHVIGWMENLGQPPKPLNAELIARLDAADAETGLMPKTHLDGMMKNAEQEPVQPLSSASIAPAGNAAGSALGQKVQQVERLIGSSRDVEHAAANLATAALATGQDNQPVNARLKPITQMRFREIIVALIGLLSSVPATGQHIVSATPDPAPAAEEPSPEPGPGPSAG